MLLFYMEKVSLCPPLMDMGFCADPVAWSEAGRRLCDGPIWTDIKILRYSSYGPICEHPAEISPGFCAC